MSIFLLSLIFISRAQSTDIVLYPGFEKKINTASNSIQVEQKGIISVRDKGTHVFVIGKKIGSTQMKFAAKTFTFHVISHKNYKTFAKLQLWSNHKLGPSIQIHQSSPILSGKLLLFEDWLELSDIMTENDFFESQLKITEDIEIKIKNYIKINLEKHHLPFSDFATNRKWTMHLNKKQLSEIQNYKKILHPLGIAVESSQFVVSSIPMLEIKIIVAEVNKKNMSQLGVSWPEQTVLQPFAKRILNKDTWSLTINHLEQKGWGKILASPTLVTQSGEEATFHSGGEVPIRTANQFNTSVVWKKYGIIMKIKPLVDFKGNIDVIVECEASMLDGSTLIDGAPGLLINKITSHFNLQESRTIALSGLIKEDWATAKNGLPGIKDIPIIGNLFSSQSYLNHRSELMFFVTPQIIKWNPNET